jgi:PhnB protein
MTHSYKPEGYSTVSPYLIVNGAAATIGFLEGVFGAREIRRFTNEDGFINHAEVRLDETVFMIGDAVEEWPSVPAHLHIYVPDVDEVYRRAVAAGATSIQKPVQKGDPDKRGGVRFPTEITWWLVTHMGEV